MLARIFRRFASLGVVAAMAASGLLLASCSDDKPSGPLVPASMSFTRYQPIYLDVANIDIVEEYKSPMQEPNVEHLLPYSPAEAMRQWVKDRIRSVGLSNTLQVIIKDASVVGVELPVKDSLTGYFSPGPDRRYDARLEVELRIYSSGAMSEANVVVVATQSNTISKAASVAERKAAFMGMLTQLMEPTNAELEKQIFKYFTRFIIYAQTP